LAKAAAGSITGGFFVEPRRSSSVHQHRDLAMGQLPGAVCGGGAERLHWRRLANLDANRLSSLCRTVGLRIGHAYQAAHDWHLRVPPMAA